MTKTGRRICTWMGSLGLLVLVGCRQDDSGLAICEQIFRADGQALHPMSAGCSFSGDHWSTTFTPDPTADSDIRVSGTISRNGLKVTATYRGTTVATQALSASQLESGEKSVLLVSTLGGEKYEFRYWVSRTIDPSQYMDGIDGGWTGSGWI
jgi:hypothetical protein